MKLIGLQNVYSNTCTDKNIYNYSITCLSFTIISIIIIQLQITIYELFIILYNILKIAELDCCQIIILSIYVPSTHAYTHVLHLSLDLPYETR